MREVVFVAPVFVGDIVSFYTELVRIGRTSITINVEAERISHPYEYARVTEAEVEYVAVDENRRPVPVLDKSKQAD